MTEPSADPRLFTPGPLTTSATVKQAMLHDLGSRDVRFIAIVREIRERLLGLAGVAQPDYEAVIMQGSGTFGVEAAFSSLTPPDGKWLLLINGAYGRRMATICEVYGIPYTSVLAAENVAIDPAEVAAALAGDDSITHLAAVHCETTTGLMNPVGAIGELARQHGKTYLVDAMSSFGAVPLTLPDAHIDVLVASSNKCIEGVPGFAFALVRHETLAASAGHARTLSLDLHAQWVGLERNGQFRFTPPIQVLLAFRQALDELDAEGGVAGRAARYQASYRTLIAGMRKLGFREYVPEALQGWIINTFLSPNDPAFDFDRLYRGLSDRGMVIYPGKLTEADTFRIGNIGRLYARDIDDLLAAINAVLSEMGVSLPVTY